MKKRIILVLVFALLLALSICMVACNNGGGGSSSNESDSSLPEIEGVTFNGGTFEYDGQEHSITATGIPTGATVTYLSNKATEVGTYSSSVTISKSGYKTKTLNATLKIDPPSAATVVNARTKAKESTQQNYDFFLNFSGSVNIAGFSGTANGNYDGKYRYNSTTGEIKFVRTTSGLLLYDGTEYIVTQGSAKIKVNENEDGEIKHVKVLDNDGEELTLVNKPFEAIVNALQADNLSNIKKAESTSKYKFVANITLTADNPVLAKALSIISKQGTNLSFKDVSFTNPVSGLKLYFTLDSRMELDSYSLQAEIGFPVQGVPIKLNVLYEQTASNTNITLPSLQGIILDKATIGTELTSIYGALDTVRDSNTYSLDLLARNEFDPGWNKTATVDKYTARLYKNTYEVDSTPFVAFNHSYEYKTHHEADGAETYKYTYGNITSDGSVHRVSRKGSNVITEAPAVTVLTQFNYLTSGIRYTSDDVDCMIKTVKNGVTTYKIFLTNAESIAVNQTISDYINSNDADGVIPVNNYFDSTDYLLKEACFEVVIESTGLKSMEIETKIKYNPTAGDYTDKRITLTDTITLDVNKNLDKASDYNAPKNTTTSVGNYGLNNAKFYTL